MSTDERRYENLRDRTGWEPGPWDSEPDKVVWVDPATGLDCMIVRNHFGSWCGYVGVPEGHRWHEVGYDDIGADVHGGLTFAGFCAEGATEDEPTICHREDPGRPEHVWWVGFDCGHFNDFQPAMAAELRGFGLPPIHQYEVYRTVDYVRAQVEDLAAQAAVT